MRFSWASTVTFGRGWRLVGWAATLTTGAMMIHHSTHPICRALIAGALTSTGLIGMTTNAQPDELHIVNESGGIGVNQSSQTQAHPTQDGALILFADDRSGLFRYRIRSMSADGTMAPSSIDVQSLLSPNRSMYNVQLRSNASSDTAVLSWREYSSGYIYKAVRLDASTGYPLGSPVTIDEYDLLEMDHDGRVLLFSRENFEQVQVQFLDANLAATGAPVVVIDESDLDFSNGIQINDVAFADDGSFSITWLGTLPPYFERVESQRFSFNGTPVGPKNAHTNEELFGIQSHILQKADGTTTVGWVAPSGYMAQTLDANGAIYGDAALVFGNETGHQSPQQLIETAYGDIMAIAHDGMSRFDSQTLALIDSTLWEPTSQNADTLWMPQTQSALMSWRELNDDDFDYDIMGRIQPMGGTSSGTFELSDDVNGGYQSFPAAASNSNGRSVVAWLDKRFSQHGNIAFQMYDEYGNKEGLNQFLNTPSRHVMSPQVAMNSTGAFVVTWLDYSTIASNPATSLRAQRFTADGQANGSPFVIYTEQGFLEPLFASSTCGTCNPRHLLLTDNGMLFATWGLRIVTGGTIGNPQYGRTDLVTKVINTNNQYYAGSSTQKLAGAVHGLVQSGPNSAQVLYYNTNNERLQLLELHASSTAATDTAFPTLPDVGAEISSNTRIAFERINDVLSIAWAQPATSGSPSQGHVAQYNADGTLLSAETLNDVNEFCMMARKADGTLAVLHGTESEISCTLYGADGGPLGATALLSDTANFSISSTGRVLMSLYVVGDQLRYVREVDSYSDQANEIELAGFDIDVAPCNPADFDCNGIVNGYDLGMLLGNWGSPGGDLNGDGTTDGADLTLLLGAWNI